jgi:hypothetical protein
MRRYSMMMATNRNRARPVLLGLLVAAALVAVTTLATALWLGGGTKQATAQDESVIIVSLDADTSDGPCTDIDSSVSHATGDIYSVAICAQDLYDGYPIGSFTFDVMYDDTKNIAPEAADTGEGLDDNPDANAGATFWGDGLGTGWDCSGSTLAYPKGDRNPATGPGNGDAFIACESLGGPWTLGDNETAGVIAVISFAAITEGTDTLEIADTSYLAYSTASTMGECDPDSDYPMTCNDASNTNGGAPVPVPTASAGPTVAPPPVVPPPTENLPPAAPAPATVIVAPPTGSGPSADGSPWTPLVWLLAGAAGAAIAAGGLLRLAKGRQR